MASLTRQYDQKKLFGQIYTPEYIVERILDDVGYIGMDLLGKSILDPSCGDGQFLLKIVSRILEVSLPEDLEHNLSFVHGWDIDPVAILQCRVNLNSLVEGYGISVDWNLSVCNSLDKKSFSKIKPKWVEVFDYIVGNPPYVRIQHLDEKVRQLIQREYQFCKKGSTDIYIAFFELCLFLLKKEGICGLITPNSYLYTETAEIFRNYVSANRLLRRIVNFGSIQIFNDVSTYSAITILGNPLNETFVYEQAYTIHDTLKREMHVASLPIKGIWALSAAKEVEFQGKKIKDFCKIHVGITTLCDKAYFFPAERIDEHYFTAETKFNGRVNLEAEILRPIIKVSRLKSADQEITEYALFPYEKIDGSNTIISEQKMKSRYPLAYQYLSEIRPILDKRDNGKPNSVLWYAYGRNQGINLPDGKKILFSPINKYPNFIEVDKEASLFYSGYCLITVGDTESLLGQLNSERMYDFISRSSRDFRGGWKGYNKKVVQEFSIE